MKNFKDTDNLYEYVENYFNNNEDYFLRPNHRAPLDENLRNKMKETSLKQRLDWVKRSNYKGAYSDPFQTSLFDTFDKDELSQFLIIYDPRDKKGYVDSGLFEKMPRQTMQDLFLYNEAMNSIENEDTKMLAREYAKRNNSSIYDFITQNDEVLNTTLFFELYSNIKDPELVAKIDDLYGEPASYMEMFGLKGRSR